MQVPHVQTICGEGSPSWPWWLCRGHPDAWGRRKPGVPAWTTEGSRCQQLLWWILRSNCNSGGVSKKFPDQKLDCYVGCACQRNCGKKDILHHTWASKQQRQWKCHRTGWKQWPGIRVVPARLWWSRGLAVMLSQMKHFTVRKKKVNLSSKPCVSKFGTDRLWLSLACKILE